MYDNNSATIARDGLERTLRLLLASDADEINVLAHSMGNWVTVEAFRQIKISGNLTSASKLGTVILAAPTSTRTYSNRKCSELGNQKSRF
nr:alpha/beta hydrolase [Mesorhizobium sp.]